VLGCKAAGRITYAQVMRALLEHLNKIILAALAYGLGAPEPADAGVGHRTGAYAPSERTRRDLQTVTLPIVAHAPPRLLDSASCEVAAA
jgi:hypothetical protein